MPSLQISAAAEQAFEAALQANIENLAFVILLIGGIGFLLVIWVLNRNMTNSGRAATAASDFSRALVETNARTNERLAKSIDGLSESVSQNKDIQSLLVARLNSIGEGVSRDHGETKTHLDSIKATLETISTEIEGARQDIAILVERGKE